MDHRRENNKYLKHFKLYDIVFYINIIIFVYIIYYANKSFFAYKKDFFYNQISNNIISIINKNEGAINKFNESSISRSVREISNNFYCKIVNNNKVIFCYPDNLDKYEYEKTYFIKNTNVQIYLKIYVYDYSPFNNLVNLLGLFFLIGNIFGYFYIKKSFFNQLKYEIIKEQKAINQKNKLLLKQNDKINNILLNDFLISNEINHEEVEFYKKNIESIQISDFINDFQGLFGKLIIKSELDKIDFYSRFGFYQIVYSMTLYIKWLSIKNKSETIYLDIKEYKENTIIEFKFGGFPIDNLDSLLSLNKKYIDSKSNFFTLDIKHIITILKNTSFDLNSFNKDNINYIVIISNIEKDESTIKNKKKTSNIIKVDFKNKTIKK
jgi:hypothetical protein